MSLSSEPGGPRIRRRRPSNYLTHIAILLTAVASSLGSSLAEGAQFFDLNPDESGPTPTCPDPCQSAGSGGRVNNLASSLELPNEIYAASELGGLFKTVDTGSHWVHIDGFLPTRAWDVAVDALGENVYATALYDGRVGSNTGIRVSHDGGATWQQPATAAASTAFCSAGRVDQPSAFGIAIRPDAIDEVLVGTNCGLVRSTNSGGDWAFVGPSFSGQDAPTVWDVVALPGGRTYACGEDGVWHSENGETGWTRLPDPSDATGTYRGYCSLAVDADYPDAVFVVFSRTTYFDPIFDVRQSAYFASFDGGNVWAKWPHPDGSNQKRVPMVVTNRRSYGLDVWVGAGDLYRIPCTDTPGIGLVCDVANWDGTFTDATGGPALAHGDSGDLLFDPTTTVDACPLFYSSDGGIYVNSPSTLETACQSPLFISANRGLHAQLLLGMAGVEYPAAGTEDLYMTLQDNGIFATTNAEDNPPTWTHGGGADWFDVVADDSRAVAIDPGFAIQHADPGWSSPVAVTTAPFPAQPFFTPFTDAIDEFRAFSYVMTSNLGPDVVYTDNLSGPAAQAGIVHWTSLAWPAGSAGWPCGVQTSTSVFAQFFVLSHPDANDGACLWRSHNHLWYTVPDIQPWVRLDDNNACPGGGIGIFAINREHPNRIYASCTSSNPPAMIRTEDVGTTWQVDQNLTDLMTGFGKFVPKFDDPDNGVTFSAPGDAAQPAVAGGVQPVMVAFDPTDQNLLVAGGYESGLFISSDGGLGWALLTDPYTPSVTHKPHLPRPFYAHFSHDASGALAAIYVGSVGRGVWRIVPGRADLQVGQTVERIACRSCPPEPCEPCSLASGDRLNFSSYVMNTGPDEAENLIFQQSIPEGMGFLTLTAPAEWMCEVPPTGTSGSVRCTSDAATSRWNAAFMVEVEVGLWVGDVRPEASLVSNALDPTPSDNRIGITYAPEPNAVDMLIAGIFTLGWLARRRR